jgi:hypothetical protein
MNRRFLPFGYFILIICLAAIFISAQLREGDEKPGVKDETATGYFSSLRVNQVTGMINPADVMRAVSQAERSGQDAPRFAGDWDLLGPNNLSGRTRALLFDGNDASGSTVFAGSVMGGMYKSTNGGTNWVKLNHDNPSLNVSCITQSSDGTIFVGTGEGFTVDQYTVLEDWNYASGLLGKGIYKSTDGENFLLIPSTAPVMNGEEVEWGYVNELAVTPTGNGIYAATNTGLKFSPDGGNSWQFAKSAEGSELNTSSRDVKTGSDGLVIAEVNNLCYISADGNPEGFVLHSSDSTYELPDDNVGRIEFAIAPSNPDIIYAVVVSSNGALVNVYRTEDSGMNWAVVGPGGSGLFNVFNTGSNTSNGIGLYNCVVTVFPDDPDRLLLGGLNLWEGKKTNPTGFFDWTGRSDNTLPWLSTAFLFGGHNAYAFKPGNPGICLIGTNGGVSQGTLSSSEFVFESRNKDLIGSQFYTVSYSSEKRVVAGGAQEIGTIYIDGKTNPADNKRGEDIWTTASNVPDGANGGYVAMSLIFPEAVIYSRSPHPAKNGNIETFVRRNEYLGGPDWSASMFNDRYASSGFLSPFSLWESFTDANNRDSVGLRLTKDYPAGSAIWIESNNANRPFKYITPVNLQKGDSIVVQDPISVKFFIGGDNRVMMSPHVIQFDRTPDWYVIANATTGFEGIPTALAHSADANHVFVGTKDGKLFRISNISFAYDFSTADVTSPYCVIATRRIPVYLPGTTTEITQTITSIAVDPNDPERIIITLGNYGNDHYVYYSDNALDEDPVFRSVQGTQGSGGLPQMPAYSSLFEMDSDNNIVFIGTEYGLYYTQNIQSTNPTWAVSGENIGKLPVFMLKQQIVRKTNDTIYLTPTDFNVYEGVNNFGVIYGATYGRGLIALDEFQQPVGIGEPPTGGPGQAAFRIFPNPADDRIIISFETASNSKVLVDVFDLNGRILKTVDAGTLFRGPHELPVDCANLPSGTFLVRLTIGQESSVSKLVIH